jgi:hypothetical protein
MNFSLDKNYFYKEQRARAINSHPCSVLLRKGYEAYSPAQSCAILAYCWGGGVCVLLPLELEPLPEVLLPLMLESLDSFLFFLCFLAFLPDASVAL